MNPSRTIVEIAVNAPLDRLFHYQIPSELRGKLKCGHRVLVPFGRRTATGVCVGFPKQAQVQNLKPVHEILQPECQFDAHLLELTRWISNYYFASWGEVLEAALPPGIRARQKPKKPKPHVQAGRSPEELQEEASRLEKRAPAQSRLLKALASNPDQQQSVDLIRNLPTSKDAIRKLEKRGFVITSERFNSENEQISSTEDISELNKIHMGSQLPGDSLELNEDQSKALDVIRAVLDGKHGSPPPPVLIHGITGSGKTEVYLRALHDVLRQGGRGLVLVPEISLTPQTVARFKQGLPGINVAILHSMLTVRQRAEQWRDVQSGRVGIVIGARSAVFSPIPDLKLIVIDEEHEPSYKQESSPRYNGRDVAIMRAHMSKIPVILGSATPSMESYNNARVGKYILVELPRRATTHDLPTISVVSMGSEFYRPDGEGLICGPLDFQIKKCLQRKEQVILFLNRRGFSTYLHCVQCGFVLKCDFCDIALTYHHHERETRCHYCDARYTVPRGCPECQFPTLKKGGVGTEKVVEVITRRYKDARVQRMDRDTVKNQNSLKTILEDFSNGKTDIIVGTQMIAKGHDFPRVSLVGILSADSSLHFPEFRSAERTFQIITQVSGRAGRGESAGHVFVQTFSQDHYAIQHAVTNDYSAFFEIEAENRKMLRYPPFGRIAKVLIQDEKLERARSCAENTLLQLKQAASNLAEQSDGDRVDVLGPAEAPITRIQEKHRYHILIKASGAHSLQKVLRSAKLHKGGRMSSEVIVDVDPQTMM